MPDLASPVVQRKTAKGQTDPRPRHHRGPGKQGLTHHRKACASQGNHSPRATDHNRRQAMPQSHADLVLGGGDKGKADQITGDRSGDRGLSAMGKAVEHSKYRRCRQHQGL